MANMTVQQRNQLERLDMGDTPSRLNIATPAQRRLLSMLTPVFAVVLGLLVYAAARVFDGWPHAIVIGDLIVVFFGVAAWVWPRRKHA